MLPAALAVRVRAAIEAGTPPIEPRDSATVMLLRPAAAQNGSGVEVYVANFDFERVFKEAPSSGVHG